VNEPVPLVAVTESLTAEIGLDDVAVEERWLLAGPAENVMKTGIGAATGGLVTSALALGLSDAAVASLERFAQARPNLQESVDRFRRELRELEAAIESAAGQHEEPPPGEIRARANSLVLRATQANLAAAKGSGFRADHPAGRWARQALFFLVWSCPQIVLDAVLEELATRMSD